MRESSEYIGSIEEICKYLQLKEDRAREVLRDGQIKTQMIKHHNVFTVKMANIKRNPLWSFVVMDLAEESWLNEMPSLSSEDEMFHVLEEIVLSKRTSLIIFKKMKKNFDNNSRKASMMKQPVNVPRKVIELKRELFAIVDLFTVMLWIAECCPESMKIKALLEEQDEKYNQMATNNTINEIKMEIISEIKQGELLPQTVITPKNNGRLNQIFVDLCTKIDIEKDYLSDTLFEEARNKREGEFWDSIGEFFSYSTVREAVTGKFLFNSAFPVSASNASHEISNNNDMGNEYKSNDVLQTDSYLYHVIERIAKGYRNIPIAESILSHSTTTHVISRQAVVSFLRTNASIIFGTMMFTPIVATGLMKKPLCISGQQTLGMAILKLSSKNIDAAIITNLKGNVCGVLSPNIIYPLWYECNEKEKEKQEEKESVKISSDLDTPVKPGNNRLSIQNITTMNKLHEKRKKGERKIKETLNLIEKLQNDYENNLYGGFHHDSINTEFFSILDRPLKYCESIGE